MFVHLPKEANSTDQASLRQEMSDLSLKDQFLVEQTTARLVTSLVIESVDSHYLLVVESCPNLQVTQAQVELQVVVVVLVLAVVLNSQSIAIVLPQGRNLVLRAPELAIIEAQTEAMSEKLEQQLSLLLQITERLKCEQDLVS